MDHMPADWLVSYANGQYPLVVVPTLSGTGPGDTVGTVGAYTQQLQGYGFKVCGSQWGVGEDPVGEAEAALGAINTYGFDGWVMNGEKAYEGGGKSAAYAMRFRESRPHFPLGWTPEIRLNLDHSVLQRKGVFYMPQVYPGEISWLSLDYAVQWALEFGYKLENVGPLVQAYETNGVRPPATVYRDDARRLGLGQLTLYTGNQCLDAPNFWPSLVV